MIFIERSLSIEKWLEYSNWQKNNYWHDYCYIYYCDFNNK